MKSFFTFLITVGTILLHAQTFEWVNQIGGSMAQISNSVTTDPEGNFYITGSFEGTVDFDPGPATYNLTSTGGLGYIYFQDDCSRSTSLGQANRR